MSKTRETSLYFPLRSGVEFFRDELGPEGRAKEGAVLYDSLVFESGGLDVSITDDGMFALRLNPESLDDEHRKRARNPVELGSNVRWTFSMENEVGELEVHPSMTIEGPVAASYVSEYHTGILDELKEFQPDWVKEFYLPTSLPSDSEIAIVAKSLDRECSQLSELLADEANEFVRTFIRESFSRDLATAGTLGASVIVTSRFEPMVKALRAETHTGGSTALSIAVPNLAGLTWESIMEFRDQPGSIEVRGMLREFDFIASTEHPIDAANYIARVSQQLSLAMQSETVRLSKGLPEAMAEQALSTTVSFVPVVGPILDAAIGVGSAVSDSKRRNSSWLAALLRLNGLK